MYLYFKTMKNFNVLVSLTVAVEVPVYASNEEMAAKKAENMVCDDIQKYAPKGEYIECFAVDTNVKD